MLLVPAFRVTAAVVTAVPPAVLWSSSDHEDPAFSEYCRVSPVARAVDRVAISVVEAVLVMESELLLPVSVPMSMPEIVVVGSVTSYQALMLACVAALPAASLMFAVTADAPAECEHQ
jgi:hypothetical protein